MLIRVFFIGFLGLLSLGAVTGCGGNLSPLYADFRIAPGDSTAADDSAGADSTMVLLPDSLDYDGIQERIAEALIEVGWEIDEAPSANAISTAEVKIVEWGLYDVRVSLDVVPINQKFVRVYVHPYRQYFWGSRSKMSYMNGRVRSYVFPDLAEAFATRGIVAFGISESGDDEDSTKDEDDSDSESQQPSSI